MFVSIQQINIIVTGYVGTFFSDFSLSRIVLIVIEN